MRSAAALFVISTILEPNGDGGMRFDTPPRPVSQYVFWEVAKANGPKMTSAHVQDGNRRAPFRKISGVISAIYWIWFSVWSDCNRSKFQPESIAVPFVLRLLVSNYVIFVLCVSSLEMHCKMFSVVYMRFWDMQCKIGGICEAFVHIL